MTHELDDLISVLRFQWDALWTGDLTPGGIRRHAELVAIVFDLAEHLGVPAPSAKINTGQPGDTQ